MQLSRPEQLVIPPMDEAEVLARFGEAVERQRWRYRIALALEGLLWCGVMAWLVFLALDIRSEWRATGAVSWRSPAEFLLIGLLVWWPIIRVRIRHGYWMRNWDDTPDQRGT